MRAHKSDERVTVPVESLKVGDVFFFNFCNNKIDRIRPVDNQIRLYCGSSWMTFDPTRIVQKVTKSYYRN